MTDNITVSEHTQDALSRMFNAAGRAPNPKPAPEPFDTLLGRYLELRLAHDHLTTTAACDPNMGAADHARKQAGGMSGKLMLALSRVQNHPEYPAYVARINAARLAMRQPHEAKIARAHAAVEEFVAAMSDLKLTGIYDGELQMLDQMRKFLKFTGFEPCLAKRSWLAEPTRFERLLPASDKRGEIAA